MIHIIKGIIKWVVPSGIFALLKKTYYSLKRRNRKVSYGAENKGKTFYVVAYNQEPGLMSVICRNLSHVSYALEHGYIPVIDMKNHNSWYLRQGMLHKENVWEYYFEQPAGYTVEMIQKSRNIILTKNIFPDAPHKLNGNNIFWDSQALLYWRGLYKKYIRFNKKAWDYISEAYNTIFAKSGEGVLGVGCRGTDYLTLKPANHPIQPDPMDVVNKAKQVMQEQSCNYLFLATEDEDIYELFEKNFSSCLLAFNQKRVRVSDVKNYNTIGDLNDAFSLDRYLIGLDYLTVMYLLSRCNCLIGGACGTTSGAFLMAEGFDYEYIWSLGIYK